MKIINPQVEKYIYSILQKRDATLSEMERYAKRNRAPIVGPAVGRLLAQLVELTAAKRIFELGSAIGYSTLWMARAAGTSGAIHYTDGNPANAERAKNYLTRGGVAERVTIHVGDALTA